jgi:hypothetical protein
VPYSTVAGLEEVRRIKAKSEEAPKLPSTDCVVKVAGGRGFIIKHPANDQISLIVTAAHCLPKIPEPHAFQDWDSTYENLLGSVSGGDPTVWAELVFADPIADIAVLQSPDNQELYEQADAYDALTEDVSGFSMASAKSGSGWFLSLDGKWMAIRLETETWKYGQSLEIDPTVHGQSGSPILNELGEAVGVIAIGCMSNDGNQRSVLHPILSRHLPAWLAPTVR